MRDVFLSMIGDNRKLLRQVDDFQTIYGKGYVGWIGGERVLAGNRQLMQQFEIELPSLEYEKRHTVNQRRVIYLAVSGKLYSMFLVAYQADPDTAVVLESLRRTGMSLLVDADDFNCDETLLEAAYNLPPGSVRVLMTRPARRWSLRLPGCPKAKAICCIWAALQALSAGWKPRPARPKASAKPQWCFQPRCCCPAYWLW